MTNIFESIKNNDKDAFDIHLQSFDPRAYNALGYTPLQCAMCYSNKYFIDKLWHVSDLTQNAQDGWSHLMIAAAKLTSPIFEPCIDELLSNSRLDLNHRSHRDGITALMIAAEVAADSRDPRLAARVDKLLRAGADHDAANKSGKTASDIAQNLGNPGLAEHIQQYALMLRELSALKALPRGIPRKTKPI